MSGASELFRVRSGSKVLWLCAVTADGEVYVYVPKTGLFHRNDALADDYYVDQRLVYEPVDARVARELIANRAGELAPGD